MKFKDTKYGDWVNRVFTGNISVPNMKLTSLEGAPKEVYGDFNCSRNNLTSLEGAPKIVYGDFECLDNRLTSLDGAPKIVKGYFTCYDNPLTQSEIDKLVKVEIKGDIIVPDGLIAPTKNDYRLYKKLGDKKYFKLKELRNKLK